jgi:hypothetical protein
MKRREILTAFGLMGLALWSAPACASDVALIGLAADGTESVQSVPVEKYTSALRQAVEDTRDTALSELACAPPQDRWRLQTVGVGLMMTGTLGLGPLISVQGAPRVLLFFTREKRVIFPLREQPK